MVRTRSSAHGPAPCDTAIEHATRSRVLAALPAAPWAREAERLAAASATTAHEYLDRVCENWRLSERLGTATDGGAMERGRVATAVALGEDAEAMAAHERAARLAHLDALVASASSGAMHCRKCSSDRITVQQKQTRSADEGMTVFCSCDQCGHQWRMS